jgi:hypothetical protein
MVWPRLGPLRFTWNNDLYLSGINVKFDRFFMFLTSEDIQ